MGKVSGKSKRRNFSSFDLKAAFKELAITKMQPWQLEISPLIPSDFFNQHLHRLHKFDLRSNERGKELLIDAFCQEAIQHFERLKIWKGAAIASDTLSGEVDYLVTEDRDYLEAPFLCVVEAKKDDFEQGLAQCLVEMKVCQWSHQQMGKAIAIQGIVSNGTTWEFYQLSHHGQVYESVPCSINDPALVLGALHYIFTLCEKNTLV